MDVPYLNLNINLPVAAWAAGRGIIVPARSGKNEAGWVSVRFASLLRHSNSALLINEQMIEKIRLARYPMAVSRLTGLFYFGSYESAKRAEREWGRSFNSSNLTPVEIIGNGPTSRYDSNWYTDAPRENSVFDTRYIDWIDHYLAGEPMPTKEPFWEYVTERRLKILDTALQQRAIAVTQKNFPESIIFFEIACAGARTGFDVGNISGFIRMNEGQYELNWLMDMRDAENPAFLKLLREPGMIGDINEYSKRQFASGSFGRTPDLRPYGWRGDFIY